MNILTVKEFTHDYTIFMKSIDNVDKRKSLGKGHIKIWYSHIENECINLIQTLEETKWYSSH